MKSPVLTSFTVVFIVTIAFAAYAKRYQIEAQVWHWQHGNSAKVGDYEVPVPQGWLVMNFDSNSFTIANTEQRSFKELKFRTAASITVILFAGRSPMPPKPVSLEYWLSFKRQWLDREGVNPIEERRLNFGETPIACIGGGELAALARERSVRLDTDIVSLECKSADSNLGILFEGDPSDLQLFYSWVPQIRRK